ncbi:tyrosine-protein phosphatase [Streptomyces sp. RPA4-5]|uniref:tyrosine-protein phosphatase n=1 Tax=Streptomyces sp. RPA4-5 TaxID=2721245 RepID=UPI00143EE54A|nr:tyrosine-protein phosphatase [Streptomyces sp. RPA4-5]QIY53705.1 tyrosine-protein phosphatase [Streptomyces sp. RPA4-5]
MSAAPGINYRIPLASGLRPGMLHRSGDLTAFTADEAGLLVAQHGLASVLDLRSDPEVARYGPPSGLLAHGVRWLRVPLTGYPRDTIAARRPGVGDRTRYLHGILTDAAPGSWPFLFRTLARAADRPFLLSCHFGKDRTGVVVAAVLALVGAPRHEIAADYAAGMPDLLAKADRFRDKWLRRGHTREEYLSRLHTSPATMDRWLAEVTDRHCGFEQALLGLGVAAGDLARVRGELAASAPLRPGHAVRPGHPADAGDALDGRR